MLEWRQHLRIKIYNLVLYYNIFVGRVVAKRRFLFEHKHVFGTVLV